MAALAPEGAEPPKIDPALLDLMGLKPLAWTTGEVEHYSLAKLQDAIAPVDAAMLLEAGHVVDWADETGRTALHVASGDGVPGAVELLLAAGASATAADGKHGMTPLHRCAASGMGWHAVVRGSFNRCLAAAHVHSRASDQESRLGLQARLRCRRTAWLMAA